MQGLRSTWVLRQLLNGLGGGSASGCLGLRFRSRLASRVYSDFQSDDKVSGSG